MGDISASRGRVEGMDMNDRGQTQINATVPLAEIADYATRLRSLSRGTGEFSMSVSGYEQVPHDVQERLAKEYADRRAAGK